ncbi:MAG TPA: triose-phosphate isomerase [Nitrospira sp.]|nr:triose-phosphate isomerase [Nitrospira sp.]
MRTRFIVGNWKMNKTASEAAAFVRELERQVTDVDGIHVGLTPPFTALQAVRDALGPVPRFLLGAQNLYWEDKGAYTGEVSGPMLKELGCRFVLIGHSERRQYFGDQDSWTHKKVSAAIRHGLQPILCVGETLQDRDAGQTDAVIHSQLNAALSGIDASSLDSMTIAYEPVWAIGTGRAATPDQVVPVHQMIRRTLDELSTSEISSRVRVLYGGSVTPTNIADFLRSDDIDGALVGGACLDPACFATLVSVALGSQPPTA